MQAKPGYPAPLDSGFRRNDDGGAWDDGSDTRDGGGEGFVRYLSERVLTGQGAVPPLSFGHFPR